MVVHVLHENPAWIPPFAAAFDAAGVAWRDWRLDGDGAVDLCADPPEGVYWSRMSASGHTRGHGGGKDQARAVLSWLEAAGRRVVNGRRVLELEMSKADQLTALRAAGIDVPATVAVAGTAALADQAARLPVPFVVKHNQGGKGLGVHRFDSHAAFVAHLASPAWEPPIDGITLLQEYVEPAAPFITRVEIVGGRFVYALTASTAGGFELCPAEACGIDGAPLFALRDGEPPVVPAYLAFAARHGIDIAGFEYIETPGGRLVTYDVNTNTNYSPDVEARAPRSGPGEIARFLRGLSR